MFPCCYSIDESPSSIVGRLTSTEAEQWCNPQLSTRQVARRRELRALVDSADQLLERCGLRFGPGRLVTGAQLPWRGSQDHLRCSSEGNRGGPRGRDHCVPETGCGLNIGRVPEMAKRQSEGRGKGEGVRIPNGLCVARSQVD
jgi:hypothetical protein